MAIDYDAIDAAIVTFPTKKIPVPELAAYFPEGEDPKWEIKSLTGEELAIANEAHDTFQRKTQVIKALAGKSRTAMEKGLELFLNNSMDDVPEDLARRHKILEFGTVPRCPENICVKLFHSKATLAWHLTNEILAMTGEGARLGE